MSTAIHRYIVPMLPASVVRLMAIPPSDPAYFEIVLATASRDPGLTSLAFHLANSPAYGGHATVEGLSQALMRLGARRYVTLILSSHLVSVFVPASPEMSQLWRHGILVTTACRHLAERFPRNGVEPDWAAVAGLLHNLGAMVLALHHLEDYRRLLAGHGLDERSLQEAETELFGMSHVAVGRLAASAINLPPDVVEAIEHHHDESLPPDLQAPGLVRLVQLAIAFAGLVAVPGDDHQALATARARISRIAAPLGIQLGDEALQSEIALQIQEEAKPEHERLGIPCL